MVGSVASEGVAGVGSTLPHAAAIQRAFGKHDISGVMAHVGGGAAEASACIGAKAYAFGGKVAFAGAPDLHTAAHEAAHVIQQRNGAVAASGLGDADDDHERNADRVADKVVAGESAEALLDATATGGHGANSGVVQRKLADDVKTKALGAVNLPLDAALPGRVTPRIPPDLFSGTRSIQLETEFGAGPVVQRAIDAASANAPNATHGTVESQIVGRVRDQSRDLMTSSAFTWHAGPHGATAIAAPAVDEFLDPLVYTSDAKTRTLTAEVTHARRSDAEPFTVHIDPSPKIVAKVTSGTITGTQQIQTANDGALLASWTKHLKPKPGATVLGDRARPKRSARCLRLAGSRHSRAGSMSCRAPSSMVSSRRATGRLEVGDRRPARRERRQRRHGARKGVTW